jgi:hypothetical protein
MSILVAMKFNIRLLYLYLFSFVGLLIAVIGSIRLIELGMKVYVFNGADQYEYVTTPIAKDGQNLSNEELTKQSQEEARIRQTENTRQRQREIAGALSMLLVGFPLYKFHWRIIQKEDTEKRS